MSSLEISALGVAYGKVPVLRNVTMRVPAGTICAVLGANGAGKSTLLKSIVGLVPVRSGSIRWEGKDITRMPAHEAVPNGIALSPEGRRLFPDLTVLENLKMGAFRATSRQQVDEALEQVVTLFPRLGERARQTAGSLSGGEQQMCAIARALMSRPRLLLLDEPSLGLAPKVIAEVAGIVRDVNAMGITMIIVEQNARLALRISHYGYVLETGNLAMEGPAGDLLENPYVQSVYLGEEIQTEAARFARETRAFR